MERCVCPSWGLATCSALLSSLGIHVKEVLEYWTQMETILVTVYIVIVYGFHIIITFHCRSSRVIDHWEIVSRYSTK